MTEVLDTGSTQGPDRSPMVALSSSRMPGNAPPLVDAPPASVLLLLLEGRAVVGAAVWMDGTGLGWVGLGDIRSDRPHTFYCRNPNH